MSTSVKSFPFADAKEKKQNLLAIRELINSACAKRGMRASVEPRILIELLECYAKDIRRISEHQDKEIAPGVWIGFLMFWVCKLKPITRGVDGDGTLIVDANEQIAVTVAYSMFKSLAVDETTWKITGEKMPEGHAIESLRNRLDFLFSHQVRRSYETWVYSLRHRNLTGDALALMIGTMFNMVFVMNGAVHSDVDLQ